MDKQAITKQEASVTDIGCLRPMNENTKAKDYLETLEQ